MKQLRVLTGRHAGVHLLLSASKYRIAADEQADIQLVDWPTEPLELELLEEGNVVSITAPRNEAPDAEAGKPESFVDFEPRRFGEVVLCVGPASADWPSDIELMERLMRPSAEAVKAAEMERQAQRARTMRSVLICAAVAVLAVGGAFTSVVWNNARAAKLVTAPAEPLPRQVQRAVTDAAIRDVVVRTSGDGVVVEGLLADSSAVVALRQLLSRFPSELVEHRYAAAPEIAQSIADALGDNGLSVRYRDRGVFVVDGRALQVEKLRDAAARIAADLAPLVSGIEVAAGESMAPDTIPVGAMLFTDGLQYVQTRDGVKHLTFPSQPPTEFIEPAALPLR